MADKGANLAGNPFVIVILLLLCIGWIAAGYGIDTLTLALSVLAITLTQMVLNQQRRHEAALHLKIDELVHGLDGARDEIMGIETKSEAELEELRLANNEELASQGTPPEHVSF
ncbi:MAG: low affinity iron permease family protein [Sphingorhabdus sp.]